jgi:hypothetical protein
MKSPIILPGGSIPPDNTKTFHKDPENPRTYTNDVKSLKVSNPLTLDCARLLP